MILTSEIILLQDDTTRGRTYSFGIISNISTIICFFCNFISYDPTASGAFHFILTASSVIFGFGFITSVRNKNKYFSDLYDIKAINIINNNCFVCDFLSVHTHSRWRNYGWKGTCNLARRICFHSISSIVIFHRLSRRLGEFRIVIEFKWKWFRNGLLLNKVRQQQCQAHSLPFQSDQFCVHSKKLINWAFFYQFDIFSGFWNSSRNFPLLFYQRQYSYNKIRIDCSRCHIDN